MPSVPIIDDEDTMRDLCRIMVKQLSFLSLAAGSGTEGDDLALEHRPFLILLDLRLPIQDWAETCRRLRARGYSGAIARMSTLQNSADFEIARICGAHSYLAKPIVYQRSRNCSMMRQSKRQAAHKLNA